MHGHIYPQRSRHIMAERKLMFFLSFLSLGMAQWLLPLHTSNTQWSQSGMYNYTYNPYFYNTSTNFSMLTNSTSVQYTPILVKENKTWEEALQYCRAYHTQLACPTSDTQLLLDENETAPSQTVSVWMGLHFLDGKWIWVNGQLVGSLVSLPSCPVHRYRCGARNTSSHLWENADCLNKLNFICYWRWVTESKSECCQYTSIAHSHRWAFINGMYLRD